jgi:nicotinamidase-related amidase
MNLQLLIVDPQNDFCIADDKKGNKGTLVVPGAEADVHRLSAMIRRLGSKIDDIHVTLDSHRTIGIERPNGWWKRASDGASPAPFTCLGIHPDGKRVVKFAPGGSAPNAFNMSPTEEEYVTVIPSFMHSGGPTGKGSFGYLQALAARGKYPHIIWTEHCVIGTWGHNVVPELGGALRDWELQVNGFVDFVTKGSNPFTEHFSAIAAEIPDPKDPATQVNTRLIRNLEEADLILVTGEALSHCVASTIKGVAENFANTSYVSKLVLLTDATSNVGGFEFLGDAFVKELMAKGMRCDTTTGFSV